MKRPTVLYLAPQCNAFIEETVRACAPHLEGATLLVHHNALAEVTEVLPVGGHVSRVRKLTKKGLIPCSKLPDNIQTNLVSFPYLVPDASNRALAENIGERFIKFIDRHDIPFDLIHAHNVWPMGAAGTLLKEEFNVPLIITADGYDVNALPFRDEQWSDRISKALSSADSIIVVSKSHARSIDRLGAHGPIRIIPNGFRADIFHPLSDREAIRCRLLLPRKKIILSVGGLKPVKGHEVLIDATARLVKAGYNLLTVIVGSGKLRGCLGAQAADLGLQGHVRFVGTVPREELPQWINACDVFALPSLMDGSPTVMLECLGCGIPLVGTRVGSIPEVINSDEYGLLCEPNDPVDLANQLSLALEKKWDSKKIVEYSRRFTWEKVSQEVVHTYQGVLAQQPQFMDMYVRGDNIGEEKLSNAGYRLAH
jgi:teichuronic acid biosynthesis glycosyltransferase TuaC